MNTEPRKSFRSQKKNEGYVYSIVKKKYGACKESLEDYPKHEDLTGRGDYIDLATNLIDRINSVRPGLFGGKPYKIISIERRPEIYISCGGVLELRDLVEAPYANLYNIDGAPSPSPTRKKPSDFDPWDYPGMPIDAERLISGDEKVIERFKEEGRYFFIPESIWTEGFCNDCNGVGKLDCSCNNGKLVCPTCRGKEIECQSCHGSGSSRCRTCSGRGSVTEHYVTQEKEYWNFGDGGLQSRWVDRDYTSQEVCPECDGTGDVTCYSCDGSGTESCYTCNDKGYITCPDCNGTKKAICKTCYGNGEKLNGLGMWQNYYYFCTVAPVTGFRTNSRYNITPMTPPIVPGEPLSQRALFKEDRIIGQKEGTEEPESFMGVNLKPYFDNLRDIFSVYENEKETITLRYDYYFARAHMRDCIFVKYKFQGSEREFCYFPDYKQIICDMRHYSYTTITNI